MTGVSTKYEKLYNYMSTNHTNVHSTVMGDNPILLLK